MDFYGDYYFGISSWFIYDLLPFQKGGFEVKDTFTLWFKVVVACVPSVVIGLLFDDYLYAHLHAPIVIAIMLIGVSRVAV